MSNETAAPTISRKGSISPRKKAKYARWAQYGVAAVLVLIFAVTADWAALKDAFWRPSIVAETDYASLGRSLVNTIVYTVLGFSLALAAGVLLALMRLSPAAMYRVVATVYIEFFRGVPALLVFLALGYGIPMAFGVLPSLHITVAAALGLVGSAYVAETVRAGIQAVPQGQIEAARSLGMSPTKTMIFVVIPQAFRIILPPLTNELILLTKDSSLIYVLGLTREQYELTKFGKEWMNQTANLTPIIIVGLCYLIITVPLGRLVRVLEQRNAKG